ncbi:MAG: nuclear transport factor 2 family protein [Proteobacteria bacterium]|nr:nuclear transport factor 2 family protein [Pseudomonadota bacterium]
MNAATPIEARTADIMRRFNEAFLRHQPALLDALIAENCELENTAPAPDGARHVGRAACLAVWHGIAGNRDGWFEPERTIVCGERAIIQWRYRWGSKPEESLRGVNLMRVHDGLIVEAQGYVKGA